MTSAHYYPKKTGGVYVRPGGVGGGGGGGSFVAEWWDGVNEGNVKYTADWQEVSGITRAVRTGNEDFLWFQSDGSINKLLAVRTAAHASGFSGDQGEWTLQGVTGVDFEDITSGVEGAQPYLYLWDGGNNANAVDSRGAGIDACIYRIKEPAITGSNGTILSSDIEKIDVAFPAGNIPTHRDIECIMFDPIVNHLYMITKRVDPPQMYRLPLQASFSGIQTLTYAGAVMSSVYPFSGSFDGTTNGGYIVGGDISPDGSAIALKNYTTMWYIPRNISNTVSVELQNVTPQQIYGYVGGGRPSSMWDNEPQGEAVCWRRNGRDLYTFSEAGDPDKTGASASNFPLRRYDMAIKAATRKQFQYGVSPIASWQQTNDTYVFQSVPSTPNGTQVTFVADKDYTGASVTDQRQSLIKFTLDVEIPSNATIIGAELELVISAEGQDFDVHAMLIPWDDNSTWNSLSGGVAIDDVDARSTYISRHGAPLSTVDNHGYDTITGTVKIKSRALVDLVQDWVDGTLTNNGLLIVNSDSLATTKGDGFQFHSAEAVTASNRPRLTVRYYQP